MVNKTKILVIDDEAFFCHYLQKMLIKSGEFEVEIATNGHRGIALAQTAEPDLIILDLMMPGLSGEEVAEKLSEIPKTADIPILFLSALVTRSEEEEGWLLKEIGNASFMAKPVRPWELKAAIKIMLKQHRKNAGA